MPKESGRNFFATFVDLYVLLFKKFLRSIFITSSVNMQKKSGDTFFNTNEGFTSAPDFFEGFSSVGLFDSLFKIIL
jgi:hypothetical protein